MAIVLSNRPAWGASGVDPRWTRSDKDGIGTAFSDLSRLWFTIAKGIVTEVYFPTVDRPQVRDLQYLLTDGEGRFYGERQLETAHEYLTTDTLGFRIVNSDPRGRFRIVKEVITDPDRSCLLIHTRLEGEPKDLARMRLFALLAPHLNVGGRCNTGNVVDSGWGNVLTANKDATWLALAASVPFLRCSCGYVGTTDGWTDLAHDLRMDWEFDSATVGNIALIGEIDLHEGRRKAEDGGFVLALGLSESLHHALVTVEQSLGTPFARLRERYIEQWRRACDSQHPAGPERTTHTAESDETGDDGSLYRLSRALLLAHEDKTYDGALIASLSIPWGEYAVDENVGGYHLVWTRDMCHSATALLAAGDEEVPLRALIYLACAQNPDGGFFQNFWIDGEAYWHGTQLDETAFPVILAWRLHKAGALQNFDPYPMVRRAASFLIEMGPATPQERWEENSGYSPSTLAACITALICAAGFAREKDEEATALYFEDYADFLEAHVERWTVTTEGTLVPGIQRHYIRIHPADPGDPRPDEDPNHGILPLRNQRPGERSDYPAKDIVDAGFLELVRYGIRTAGDPLIEDSLRVVDAVLKVDLPQGAGWRRYNHDGYGQRKDGGPYQGWGYGHAWPLLTGERGHYELAAGRDVSPYIRAMERFAGAMRLLPEQVWSLADLPESHMFRGLPTGGAMPLCWAHAEYIKLVRSAADGRVVDKIPEVADRYSDRSESEIFEVWKFNRRVASMPAGGTLRVQAAAPFRLRWTSDDWKESHDTECMAITTGHSFVDIVVPPEQRSPVRFTFFWTKAGRWEGHDYRVDLTAADPPDPV